MNLVKIISTEIDSTARRIIKFLRFGTRDVQTSYEAMPYGVDSNPIKDMVAVYGETGEKGKTVILGYINKNQLTKPGETRIFSTDAAGQLKFYTLLKDDGTCEIGGTAHNLVRYSPLNDGLEAQKDAINAELTKIATALNSLIPGIYTRQNITIDISESKIDEIKTL